MKNKQITLSPTADPRRVLRAIFGLPEEPQIMVSEVRDGFEVIVCRCQRQQLTDGFNAAQLVDIGWRYDAGVWSCPFCQ